MVQLLLLWLRHLSGEGTLFIFVLVSLQDVVPLLIWCETNSRFYSKCPGMLLRTEKCAVGAGGDLA